MVAYYNELDPYAAQWLRNLIAAGHIAPGDVDERSVTDVRPADLAGYAQCHFFAGIGGWSCAARLAGWPDDRPLWTGSCPCQPFSVAGKGEGHADARHFWPEFFRLIAACRPAVVMGEQVAAAVGKHWLDGVHSDLEGIGYTCGAAVVPACAVDAPHRRDRLWFVADCERGGQSQQKRNGREDARERSTPRRLDAVGPSVRGSDALADASGGRVWQQPGRLGRSSGAGARVDSDDRASLVALAERGGREGRQSNPWRRSPSAIGTSGEAGWIAGADGKARRVEPGIRLLAHGIPARVGKLRAYGNAIVPQVAAEVIGAYLDCHP